MLARSETGDWITQGPRIEPNMTGPPPTTKVNEKIVNDDLLHLQTDSVIICEADGSSC